MSCQKSKLPSCYIIQQEFNKISVCIVKSKYHPWDDRDWYRDRETFIMSVFGSSHYYPTLVDFQVPLKKHRVQEFQSCVLSSGSFLFWFLTSHYQLSQPGMNRVIVLDGFPRFQLKKWDYMMFREINYLKWLWDY